MNPEDLNKLIRQRRSVFPKDYTGEKIADEIVWQLLENANWAPTHKLTEPWRFTVFCDQGLTTFASYQAEKYRQQYAGTTAFLQQKYQKLLTKPLKCAHIIAVGAHHAAGSPVPEVEEIAAVSCAVQNILLSATAYGLGAYWSTGGVTYLDEAKKFFSLGKNDTLLGFIYLGIIRHPPADSRRTDIRPKVRWTNR